MQPSSSLHHSKASSLLPFPAHQPQPITRRIVQILPESQVALGGLDGGVPQANLDLLERRAAEVGKLSEGPP